MRPIPTALTYVVYPRDGNNPAQVAAIAAELQKFVKDPSDIVASDTKTFGLNFWYIPLARWMVKEVRKVPGVAQVDVSIAHLWDRYLARESAKVLSML